MPTVDTDTTLRELADYLATGLNILQSGCVMATRDFDDIPQDPSSYPCLVVHRTESAGESLHVCTGRVRYMLLNQDQRSRRPGLFRWVELALVALLENYQHRPDPLLKLTNLDELRSRYRIGAAAQIFPVLEIDIEFIDYLTDL